MLGARIAQRRQIDPRKEMLATAQQDRRDRDVHLVDEPRREILSHRGGASAELDIEVARGLPGATKRFLNSAGDEMKDGPAFHRDRFARVVRQHEHRHVIRRGLAPPPPPPGVGPKPPPRAAQILAPDISPQALPPAPCQKVLRAPRPPPFFPFLVESPPAHVPTPPLLPPPPH